MGGGGRQDGVEPLEDVAVAELVVSFTLLGDRFTVSIDGRLHSGEVGNGRWRDLGLRDARGVVAAAGLTPSHPHLTPCASARRRMPWMRRTVAGASPPSPTAPVARSRRYRPSRSLAFSFDSGTAPTAGNRLRSMNPRVSFTVFGEKSPAACSNHPSISSRP